MKHIFTKGRVYRRGSTHACCFMLSSSLKGQEVMPRWVLFVLFLGICASANLRSLSRGWGDDIDWVESYEKGLEMMGKSKKPMMVIFHKEDCEDCQALKKAFVEYELIQKMAKEDFIMVNLVEETKDKDMAPDGEYVPRIIFVDPSLTVRKDIGGKYSDRVYTYEAVDTAHLTENMKLAKKVLHSEL